jgi:2,3-bisphosphoglycerate-independent phosphoglycerate mutase
VVALLLAGLQLPSYPQHAVSVRYATEHRCGVVVRGPGLSDAISGTDPLKDNLPLQVCLLAYTRRRPHYQPLLHRHALPCHMPDGPLWHVEVCTLMCTWQYSRPADG